MGELAVGVVFHVKGDGATGLGAATDVVELEAHEGLDEGALSFGLVTDDEDGRRVEGGVKFLGERVELVVGLVHPLLRDRSSTKFPIDLHFLSFFLHLSPASSSGLSGFGIWGFSEERAGVLEGGEVSRWEVNGSESCGF